MTGHGGEDGAADGEDREDGTRDGHPEAVQHLLARLADLPSLWLDVVGATGPLRGARHLDELTVRIVELLELTNGAAGHHPGERPLAPLLAGCREVRGSWRLDTRSGALRLEGMTAFLPVLPLRDEDMDEDVDRLAVMVGLRPPGGADGCDTVLVGSLAQRDALPIRHRGDAELPVLAVAVRDHLVDGLATATVLARTPEGPGAAPLPAPAADRDPDAARAADRLLDLFAGFEHALARRAAAGRGPAGDAAGDAEVEHRRRTLLATAEEVQVEVQQRLPAGTLEPVRLHVTATTWDDPDGLDVLPLTYTLRLDLVAGARGAGVLEVGTWSGRSQRAVLLPHVADLWTDHLDSALRRAHVVVPAVRRPPRDDLEDPVPEVGPPVADDFDHEGAFRAIRALVDDVPF